MSEFFIRRPIVAMVISIFIVLLGLLTLQGIPIAQYPEITPPMIKITGSYNGANAVNVEQTTATPIEQQVNGVENMLYMMSVNANDGSTTIQVSFEVGTNLDNANMLTQNRVAMANPFLPAEVKNMGVNTKKALAFPLLLVSLYSPNSTYDARFIVNYAYINVVDQIRRIKGVGDVSVFGGSEYAMRVWLKPDRMNAYNISVNDIRKAMGQYNNIYPGGSFGSNPAMPGVQNTYTAQLQSRLTDPKEFGNIIVKSDKAGSGAVVRLKDIARVELSSENFSQNSRLNKQNAGAISVYQVPGSNALEVAAEIRKVMADMKERFPEDIDYRFSLDTTMPIEVGIEEIMHTLLEAVVLVILVVFLFLQDWRATLIPLLTVPVSLIGVFIFFPLLGFSVNVLSLLGLVLAIGLVVDDAIVVVEAVIHHMEHGLSPKEATQKAMKEVAGPVVAIAIILAAVFIPVALMPGITGRLYQQFAITIAVSVALSAFNALTLSPALAALLLKPKDKNKKPGPMQRFFNGFNRVFDRFTESYGKLAGFFARKVAISMIILGGIVAGAAFFGKAVPGGFVPEEDNGYFMMGLILPDAASFERTDAVSRKAEDLLATVDGIESYTVINGFNILNSTVATNAATVFVQLKKWDERRTDKEIIRQVNGMLATRITEAMAIAVGPPPIPGLGSSAGFTMQLQDRSGGTPQFLAQQAQQFVAAARQRKEIGSVFSLFRSDVPQKSIEVDKEKVEKLGLSIDEVNSTISTMLGGSFVNNFNAFGRQYRTYMQADAPYRMKPNDLNQIFIRDGSGRMVSLGTLAVVKDITGPQYTNRFNLYRTAEISGTPAPGYSSSQALAALEEVAKSLPQSMGYQWSNMSYQEKAAEGKSAQVFAMALLFVFLILAAQYESWKLPFSVLLGTPWAVLGALLGLWLARLMFGESYVNNVFAQIGLVMLIGLNAKNAILIVEFAKMKMEEGEDVLKAALEGAKLRFRPIIMTSLAFILGVVPLLTAYGAGAEARKVMGVTVFAGMITATIVGCILIPSFFVLIERKKKKEKLAAVAAAAQANHDEPKHANDEPTA